MNSSESQGDILIVDDTLDNLRLLSTMLEEQGYDVRSVTNASTALMGIRAQAPDLILLDINMPGVNGFDLCRQLKTDRTTQEIPVIFISALNEVFDKVMAFSVGGVDYIAKPFHVEEVIARIENQLKLCRLQTQLQGRNEQLQKAEVELRRSLEQEKALNQRIEAMTAIEERNRIARDIHDSLGHALVALSIQLETALTLWQADASKAYSFVREAKQLSADALQAVRHSVSDLRADPLQEKLLEAAIVTLTQEFHHTSGILPDSQIELSHPTSNLINTAIYRIVQEGLTNILKHADASIVQLRIHSAATGLHLTLQDNGKGFHPSANPTGFGLRGMQERASAVGGQLSIDSTPQQGCRITAFFPSSSPR
ncbi:response regulator [Phormidium tenue FACHB-886]|nr:response regulator [Phormidium tenue FACHB-886]